MAYASTWRRDGRDAERGGAWRPGSHGAELCVIPGCANPVGAAGDGCPDCRIAYGEVIAFEAASAGVECWLCGTAGAVVDSVCPTCCENVLESGLLVLGGCHDASQRTG
ncbi:hypothetical protein ACFYVR_18255 [Rhodococcus sp. NPDC003318]|uniref:hypothetical protein n=1 Tax=Rhodococcus sp. NPDC003318 TaxID=3364503 RepID=UPI0036777BD0